MKERSKKIRIAGKLAVLMALSYSMLIPGTLHAENTGMQEIPQVYSSDVTQPVIESIIMEGNKTAVQAGESLPIKIKAYDLDDGIDKISVDVEYTAGDERTTHEVYTVSGEPGKESKEYVVNIPAKAGGYIKADITNITVTDKNSNYVYANTTDGNEYCYSFTITGGQAVEVAIQEITIAKNTATLNRTDKSDINIRIADEQKENVSYMEVSFYNQSLDEIRTYPLENDETNIFKGTISAYSNMSNGKWILKSIRAEGQNDCLINITYKDLDLNSFWFKITGEEAEKDTTPPVITSLNMSHKGEFVKSGDIISFEVKAKDEGGLTDHVEIELEAAADIVNKYQSITLDYNEAAQSYKGSFTIPNDLYPCEWMISGVEINDVSGNWTNSHDFFKAFTVNPFYIKMKTEDTFMNPTYDVNVYFHVLNDEGEYSEVSRTVKKKIERRTTLKDAGIIFPSGVTTYKGLQFQGWMDEDGKMIDENTEITENMGYKEIYAKYDKMVLPVYYVYPNVNLLRAEEKNVQIQPYGTTYKQLFSEVTTHAPLDLYKGESFKGWNFDADSSYAGNLESEIKFSPYNTIYLEAEYNDKTIISVDKSYYDTNAVNKYTEHIYFIDKGTTYGTFVNDLQNTPAPSSFKGLRFKGWEIDTYDEPYDKVIEKNYSYVNMHANYENYLVRFMIDSRFKSYEGYPIDVSTRAAGGLLDSEVAYIKAIVAEKNEKITVPEFPGYKKIKWVNDKPEGENLIIRSNMTFRGYEAEEGTETPVKPEHPVTPDKPVIDKPTSSETSSSKLPDKVIEKIVHSIKATEKGARVEVLMGETSIVPVEILSAAKGKDVNVSLRMNGYTWTINGKDIVSANLKDINLEVNFDTNAIPSRTAKELAGDNPVKQLSLTHNGDFGFKADLSFNIGTKYTGKYGNLYYYNSDGKLVFQNAGQIDANGNVSLSFSHASDYIIVITDNRVENTKTDPFDQKAKKESKEKKTDLKQENVSPNTGDLTNPSVLLWLCLISLVAGFVIFGKRAKAKR